MGNTWRQLPYGQDIAVAETNISIAYIQECVFNAHGHAVADHCVSVFNFVSSQIGLLPISPALKTTG